MSWKDRAIAVDDSQPTGDWRSRAIPVDQQPSDQQPPEQGSYWGDVGRNAVKEVGSAIDPRNAPQAFGTYMALTKPISGELPTPQDIQTVKPMIEGMAKGVAKSIFHPIQSFREAPLSTAANLTMVGSGAAGMAEKALPSVAEAADAGAMSLGRRALGFSKRFLNTEGKEANADAATRTALDEGIIKPFSTPETMRASAQNLQERAGNTMGSIFDQENRGATRALSPKAKPQLREQFLFDPSQAIDDLESLRPTAKGGRPLRGGDYDAQNAVIDNAIETIKAHGDRPIPWDEANQLKSHLQGLANYDTTASKSVNDLRKSIGGKFKDNLDTQLKGSMEAGARDSSIFSKAKKDWKSSEDMQKALQNRVSSEKGNQAISLGDYAAGAAGGSMGPIGSIVTIGAKKLLQKYGTTTGASALNKVAGFAKEIPPMSEGPANSIKAIGEAGVATKVLTEDKAREFLKQAKGNKNLARQLAAAAGWSF